MRNLVFSTLILSLSASTLNAYIEEIYERPGTVFPTHKAVFQTEVDQNQDGSGTLSQKNSFNTLSLATVEYLSPKAIVHFNSFSRRVSFHQPSLGSKTSSSSAPSQEYSVSDYYFRATPNTNGLTQSSGALPESQEYDSITVSLDTRSRNATVSFMPFHQSNSSIQEAVKLILENFFKPSATNGYHFYTGFEGIGTRDYCIKTVLIKTDLLGCTQTVKVGHVNDILCSLKDNLGTEGRFTWMAQDPRKGEHSVIYKVTK